MSAGSDSCVSVLIRYVCLCVRGGLGCVHCNTQVCEICCECEGRGVCSWPGPPLSR